MSKMDGLRLLGLCVLSMLSGIGLLTIAQLAGFVGGITMMP